MCYLAYLDGMFLLLRDNFQNNVFVSGVAGSDCALGS